MSDTDASALIGGLRQLLRELVREAVRDALAEREPAARPSPPDAAPAIPETPALLSVKDIAGTLDVSPKSVRRWIQDGRLHARTVGRQLRVERTEFDRFVASGARRDAVDVDAITARIMDRQRR